MTARGGDARLRALRRGRRVGRASSRRSPRPGGASLSARRSTRSTPRRRRRARRASAWAKITEDGVSGPIGTLPQGGEAGRRCSTRRGRQAGRPARAAPPGAPSLVHKVLDLRPQHAGQAARPRRREPERPAVGHHFPLVEWNEDEARCDALHHPFTNLVPEDVPVLREIVGAGRRERAARDDRRPAHRRPTTSCSTASRSCGGSIRIHREDVQSRRLPPDRHRRGAGRAALRLVPGGAALRHAAARRPRLRLRPPGDAARGRGRRSAR